MVDRLRTAGIPSVGIYASPGEWPTITGGYSRSSASTYRSAWAAFFRPAYPLELGPLFLAGTGTAVDAAGRCGTATVTGVTPLVAQYTDGSVDGDYQCAAESTDTTAPTVAMTTPTVPTSFDSTAFGVTSDGADSYDVRYRVATATTAFGGYAYPTAWQVTASHSLSLALAPGRTYCGSARARDARANLSAWSAERCTTTPVDDRSLAATSRWSRVTASGYYRSTYTQSTTNRQYLKTTVRAKRLSLVATTCARCGSVGIYVNGSLLATKSLYASSTHTRQVIALPTFSLRTATVVIKVTSPTGKVVQVDGLAASSV